MEKQEGILVADGHGITLSVLRTDPKTLIPEPSSPDMRRQAVQLPLVDNDSGEGIQTHSPQQEALSSIQKTERVRVFA